MRSGRSPPVARAFLAPAELGKYAHDLVLQRQQVGKLVEQIAHDEHIALRHSLAEPRATNRMLGLPTTVRGCVFDLDGVLTASAEIHAAAWKDVLDGFAFRRSELAGHRFAAQPFGMQDYWEHIHDRPRLEGLCAYLGSRGIVLPEGSRMITRRATQCTVSPTGRNTRSSAASRMIR